MPRERRAKVFVLSPINAKGLDILARRADMVLWDDPAVENWRQEADGIILRGNVDVTADDLARAKNLKAISKQGTGVDRIDLKAARARGIVVMNTPGLNSEAVAELSMALALAVARRVPLADRRLRLGDNVARENFDDSRGFAGKTLGVISLGNIGRRVARKWRRAFDMTVLGFDPFLPKDAWRDLKCERAESLEAMLPRVDLLSIHAPLTAETKNLIGAAELALMKPTATLVSAARGGVVNEDALFQALRTGEIFGAALDVFLEEPPRPDHPLFSLPTFVGTPHMGAGTVDSRELTAVSVVEQLVDVLDGGEPRNVAN
jgi:D-3-phosphoglycerate dehydrogenase / 2-oxoglutarate reductase